MGRKLIVFRGIKEGIYIDVYGDNYLSIKSELDNLLKSSPEFYKGTKLLGIKSDGISPEELIDLKCILKYKYDFLVSEEELPYHLLDTRKLNNKEVKEERTIFKGIEEGSTKFLKLTLRSGQTVKYDGNVVIIGDVNPGALIEAGGNIVVLGTLRGVAHAGKCGNKDSIVASYSLRPTQLRIADKIARSPDEGIKDNGIPEIARIKNGEVVIEPYLPNK